MKESESNQVLISKIVDEIARFNTWIEASKAKSDSWRAVISKESLYPDALEQTNRFTAEFIKELRSHTHHFTGSSPNNYQQQYAALAIHNELVNELPDTSVYFPQDCDEKGFIATHNHTEIVVNDDTNAYQERLRELTLSGVLNHLRDDALLVEIGGGYGGLASALKRLNPSFQYAIIDLPESLKFSYSFLSLQGYRCYFAIHEQLPDSVFIDYDFVLIPADNKHIVPERGVDLALNTLSFTEMPKSVVEEYGEYIAKWLTPYGVLFEQNNEYPEHCGEKFIQSTADVFSGLFPHLLETNCLSLLGISRLWGFQSLNARFYAVNLLKPKNAQDYQFSLFGAGKTGVMLKRKVDDSLKFSHFYDNDPSKWQTRIEGMLVHSPEQVRDDIELSKQQGKHLIIVLSSYFYHDIYQQLSAFSEHLLFINQLESYFERGNA